MEKNTRVTNEKKSNNLKITVAVLCVLAIAAIIFGIAYNVYKVSTVAGSKQYTLTVVDDNGNEKQYSSKTDAEYVGQALRELQDNKSYDFTMQGEDGQYGYYLKTINGVTADYNINGAYWALYMNSEYANYGIDQQPIMDGDQVTIKYEK